jgi:hypothetical protein
VDLEPPTLTLKNVAATLAITPQTARAEAEIAQAARDRDQQAPLPAQEQNPLPSPPNSSLATTLPQTSSKNRRGSWANVAEEEEEAKRSLDTIQALLGEEDESATELEDEELQEPATPFQD